MPSFTIAYPIQAREMTSSKIHTVNLGIVFCHGKYIWLIEMTMIVHNFFQSAIWTKHEEWQRFCGEINFYIKK